MAGAGRACLCVDAALGLVLSAGSTAVCRSAGPSMVAAIASTLFTSASRI
jgi:hypothetical protein